MAEFCSLKAYIRSFLIFAGDSHFEDQTPDLLLISIIISRVNNHFTVIWMEYFPSSIFPSFLV